MKVIMDYYHGEKKEGGEVIDTGDFSLLYKAQKCTSLPMHTCGLNLVCEGKKIKI